MQTTLRIETTVLPGNRVEFTAPELAVGEKVEVVVTVVPHGEPVRRISMIEFLKTLPPGPLLFDTWEEYEKFLQEEKNSWEQ